MVSNADYRKSIIHNQYINAKENILYVNVSLNRAQFLLK